MEHYKRGWAWKGSTDFLNSLYKLNPHSINCIYKGRARMRSFGQVFRCLEVEISRKDTERGGSRVGNH